jgi:hypothetical protein
MACVHEFISSCSWQMSAYVGADSADRGVKALMGNFLDASNSGIVTGVTRCADE